jgi:hypothetical protein
MGVAWIGDYGSSFKFKNAVQGFRGGTLKYQCRDEISLEDPGRFDRIGLVLTFLFLHGTSVPHHPSIHDLENAITNSSLDEDLLSQYKLAIH